MPQRTLSSRAKAVLGPRTKTRVGTMAPGVNVATVFTKMKTTMEARAARRRDTPEEIDWGATPTSSKETPLVGANETDIENALGAFDNDQAAE